MNLNKVRTIIHRRWVEELQQIPNFVSIENIAMDNPIVVQWRNVVLENMRKAKAAKANDVYFDDALDIWCLKEPVRYVPIYS